MTDICKLSEEYVILEPISSPYSTSEWVRILRDRDLYKVCPYRMSYSLKHMFPKSLRGEVWVFLSRSYLLQATGKPYLAYLFPQNVHAQNRIAKDVGRTFPCHKFFQAVEGQKSLANVLKAYSNYDPQTNYCQGMNFIVAVLLLHLSEENAFWTFVSIMFDKDRKDMFIDETPKLNRLLAELAERIEENDQELYRHLLDQGVEMTVFAKYFITLFACDGNIELGARVIDVFLCDGDEALFSLLINALSAERSKLLNMKYESLFTFLCKELSKTCLEIIEVKVFAVPELEDEYTML